MQNEQFWYFVVVVLVVLLVINQIGQILLSRKSVETSGNQYPPDTLEKMRLSMADMFKSMLELALNAAKQTPVAWDDQGLELVALAKGYQAVKQADGSWVLKPIEKPTVSAPTG
jgi:uncharacterized protein YneF (UPF0154 family)